MTAAKQIRELDDERTNIHVGRRQLFQKVAAGAAGLGLAANVGTASAHEHQSELEKPDEKDLPKLDPSLLKERSECPDLIKVSKYLRARVYLYGCEKCVCDDDINYILKYAIRGYLYSNSSCDETVKFWPDRTPVAAEAVMKLRQTRCKEKLHLVGCNEGTIKIYAEAHSVVSDLFGTQGFDSHAAGDDRCCATDRGEGTWKGDGIDKLEGCSLCLSFYSRIHGMNPEDPCANRTLSLSANLDGVLVCSCGQVS